MKGKKKYLSLLILFFVLLSAAPVKAGAPARPGTPALKGVADKNQVTLTWNQVKNARGYHIYLYYSAEDSFKRVLNISARAPRKATLKGKLNHVYRYKIRAYNKKGNKVIYSPMSPVLEIKTAPSQGRLRLAERRSTREAQLVWKKIPSADGYQIIRGEKAAGPYKRIASIGGNEITGYKDTQTAGKNWYYRVRAYRRNPGGLVYGAYSEAKRAAQRPLMVIGDSRTVMLEGLIGGKTDWICEVSMGYKWLSEVAVKKAEQLLKKNSDLVLWLGVNDPGNVSLYISWLNEQIPLWREKGARVYIMAVGQVENDLYVTNEDIKAFNTRMKAEIRGARYMDLYSYLERTGYRTVDGTHYDNETSKKIYDYMIKQIR